MLPGFDTAELEVTLGARRHGDGPAGSAGHLSVRYAQRRRRGAPDLRAQLRSRIDAPAAVDHHQRGGGGGQPPRGVGPGGGCLRLRRLVEQRRRARLPGDHQRGADRHHHRRVSERHLRLLQRRQGEPLRRPDEPRERRGFSGHGRHRLPLRRGAGRHLQLPHQRSGGGAHLHRVRHHRRERRRAVLHAGRHRTVARRSNARLGRRRAAGSDRLGGGLREQ